MRRRATNGRAFTLVELVLAVGITAVLAALLLVLAGSSLSLWERSSRTLRIEATGGTVIDRVTVDLAGWVQVTGRPAWRRVGDDNSAAIELRFLSDVASTATGTGDPSGIRLVSYLWERETMRLYRWESTVAACLDSGYDLEIAVAAPGGEWLLAEGVSEFEIRWLDREMHEIGAGSTGGVRPRHAELRLSLLDETGRSRLQAVAHGRSNESPDGILADSTRLMNCWVTLSAGGPL